MVILSSDQMQMADYHAIKKVGISSIVLMENACQSVALVISEKYPNYIVDNVIVIAGKGNNGGDGIGTAKILAEYGYNVELILLDNIDTLKQDPLINFKVYKNLGFKYSVLSTNEKLSDILNNSINTKTIIIDAIFGTGLNKPVKNSFFKNIFKIINNSDCHIISIDVPSGLSDNFIPDKSELIKADITISLQTLKSSIFYPDGNDFCGEIFIRDIGIPERSIQYVKPEIQLITPDIINFINKKRNVDSHKGDFGHCLNISGSKNKPGAAILSSIAILRSGAGLCTAVVSPENRDILINSIPEMMTKIYSDPKELINIIELSDIILSGPGLGLDIKSRNLVEIVLEKAFCPVILDADAINIVAENKTILKKNKKNRKLILTPHPGEFSNLTGISKKKIKTNRIKLASDFAVKNDVYLVLKGHYTIIASPDKSVYINQTGNPGMATAGSGDVLSGIITGFLSQFSKTVPINLILAAAVFVHGYAGDLAKEDKGELSMVASDIIEYLPQAIIKLNDFKSKFNIS